MIIVGVGSNLFSDNHGSPQQNCEAALGRLAERGDTVVARSPWYRTRPLPISEQPWFVNAVVRIQTDRTATQLLRQLHAIEQDIGRRRSMPNAARVIDLDLLDYDGQIVAGDSAELILPHPRMHERRFVLAPLRDIAPDWRHPVTGLTVDELLAGIDRQAGSIDQDIERMG